jgi:hypothetical protein
LHRGVQEKPCHSNKKKDCVMRTSQMLSSRCVVSVFATVCAALAAVATVMLGWIITAHGARLIPGEAGPQNYILCERIPDTFCPPDFPGLVTMPATLVTSEKPRRPEPLRRDAVSQSCPVSSELITWC